MKKKDVKETVTTAALPPADTAKSVMKPQGSFRSIPFFDCDDDMFSKCLKGKRKNEHWATFMGKNEFTDGVKAWIKENPRKSFLLRNSRTGSFIFARKIF